MGTIENHPLREVRMRQMMAQQGSEGGGGDESTSERLTRLETHFGYIRRDLDTIKSDQKAILERLAPLPTKGNLWIMVSTVGGIALALIGIFVAILTYLQSLSGPTS